MRRYSTVEENNIDVILREKLKRIDKQCLKLKAANKSSNNLKNDLNNVGSQKEEVSIPLYNSPNVAS